MPADVLLHHPEGKAMTTGPAMFFQSHVDAPAREPFPISDVLAGDPDGQVHWLRNESDEDGWFMTGLFTAQPSRFAYVCSGEETFHLLEGKIAIEMEGEADPVVVRRGDIVSFRKGAKSIWTVEEPITEFFVIYG